MDVILRTKSGFQGRIIDVLVEDNGYVMFLLESDDDCEWFDAKDLEPCDHATIKED